MDLSGDLSLWDSIKWCHLRSWLEGILSRMDQPIQMWPPCSWFLLSFMDMDMWRNGGIWGNILHHSITVWRPMGGNWKFCSPWNNPSLAFHPQPHFPLLSLCSQSPASPSLPSLIGEQNHGSKARQLCWHQPGASHGSATGAGPRNTGSFLQTPAAEIAAALNSNQNQMGPGRAQRRPLLVPRVLTGWARVHPVQLRAAAAHPSIPAPGHCSGDLGRNLEGRLLPVPLGRSRGDAAAGWGKSC